MAASRRLLPRESKLCTVACIAHPHNQPLHGAFDSPTIMGIHAPQSTTSGSERCLLYGFSSNAVRRDLDCSIFRSQPRATVRTVLAVPPP